MGARRLILQKRTQQIPMCSNCCKSRSVTAAVVFVQLWLGNEMQLRNNVECPTRGNFFHCPVSNLPLPSGRMTSLPYRVTSFDAFMSSGQWQWCAAWHCSCTLACLWCSVMRHVVTVSRDRTAVVCSHVVFHRQRSHQCGAPSVSFVERLRS